MARKKITIVYPHLNDCGGDISRDWYVEWSFRIPGEIKARRQREYSALNLPTADARYNAAKLIIAEKTEWLKSGQYLNGKVERVFEDELTYRNEAKLYGQIQRTVTTTRTYINDFLAVMKQKVNEKSYINYVSKLRIFNSYIENKGIDMASVRNITRQHIIDFATTLADNGSSRATIKKYIQILHSYFDFLIDTGKAEFNPATRIPALGKIVDMSATPFHTDERKRLKEAIEPSDPQLWLACEIQYYCAIRPGTELRLMCVGWIDFERRKLKVPVAESKSSRVDIVDIPLFLFEKMKHLQDYNKSLYVFGKFGRPGPQPLGKNTLRDRFNRYREALEIPEDRKFYSWKHTGAIQLLDNGLKPHDLQGHLRHQSFATTEVYIKKRAGNLEGKVDRFASEI